MASILFARIFTLWGVLSRRFRTRPALLFGFCVIPVSKEMVHPLRVSGLSGFWDFFVTCDRCDSA